jgi:hypothetical protein
MVRAYDKGSRNIWIVNVGDIKPAEIGTTHFLDMAWDVEKHRGESQKEYLKGWLGDAFGRNWAKATAMMDEYFLSTLPAAPNISNGWQRRKIATSPTSPGRGA